MDLRETLAANLMHVRALIANAVERAGRDLNEITLVAVSKTKPVEMVKLAYELGVRDFGENRVQEALTKVAQFRPSDVHWHMIGHIQTNKANRVAATFDYVQSVDSLHLAQMLARHAGEHGVRLPVLLEVNVAGEESKTGMSLAELSGLARQVVALPQLDVQGLMTVAPLVSDPEEVRPVFRALRLERDRLQKELPGTSWHHLSMGMTGDYSIAIEEGATIVRIGRAIFGERIYGGKHV